MPRVTGPLAPIGDFFVVDVQYVSGGASTTSVNAISSSVSALTLTVNAVSASNNLLSASFVTSSAAFTNDINSLSSSLNLTNQSITNLSSSVTSSFLIVNQSITNLSSSVTSSFAVTNQSITNLSSSVSSSLSSLDARLTIVEETGGGGSVNPDIVRGPYAMNLVDSLTLITNYSATELGIVTGSRATVEFKVEGYSNAGLGIVKNIMFTAQNLSGVMSTPAYIANTDIAQALTEPVSGWNASAKIAADGSAINIYGLSPLSQSFWAVDTWIGDVVAFSNAGLTDTNPEVKISVANSLVAECPIRIVSTLGITQWYVSETATLPGSPAWVSSVPTTFTVSAGGSHTLYCWGRTSGGTVTTRASATFTATLDSTPPTITSFVMTGSTTTLTGTILSLTANEAVTWYLNTGSTTPTTNSIWTTNTSSYLFNSTGSYTVYAWAMDSANNISTTYATQSISVTSEVTSSVLYSNTFANTTGWSSNGTITADGAFHMTSAMYQRAYTTPTSLPADYCYTVRMSAATWTDFVGLIVQSNAGGTTGVQIFWQNVAGTVQVGDGTLTYDLANRTFNRTANPMPTLGTIRQLSLNSSTSAGTTTYTLYIDGVNYGSFTGQASAANLGVGIACEGNANRAFLDCQITPSNVIPVFDGVSP